MRPRGSVTPSGEANSGTVPVVAAVVRLDGAYLVARRPASKRHGGLWEFPGGKVRPQESAFDALARELLEEMAVTLTEVGDPLFEARDPGAPFVVRFHPARIRGEPSPLEHDELRWVATAELPSLPLAPADTLFVEKALNRR